ncbi:MAG: hypothetical protein WBE38_09715 [Terracidiphilus sp.]|jgi:uncharacterized membrane protein YqhA
MGFGTHFRRGIRRTSSGLRVPVALVCVALLAIMAFVQVTHLHSNQTDADQCPVCVVMHSAAPVTVAAVVVVLVPLGEYAPQAEPQSVTHKPQSSLFIRPPPAGC